jgi:endonuclease YncB( thermonuclease family)
MKLLHFALRMCAGASWLGVYPIDAISAQASFSGIGHAKDGDSLTIGDRQVRLFGIDAPEWGQVCSRGGQPWDCGSAAASELGKLVTDKPVQCVAVDIDQYHRTVAQCTVGELDVNRTMVALGYAIAYRRYSTAYVSAEESAKANRRGLWAGTFELPSQYRREERHDPGERTARRARARVASRLPLAGPLNNSCAIKGNRGSHGWIYHLPGTRYYERTHAEQWFCTEAQAQAAGYRRSRAN